MKNKQKKIITPLVSTGLDSVKNCFNLHNPSTNSGFEKRKCIPDQQSLESSFAPYPDLAKALAEFIDNSGEYRLGNTGETRITIEDSKIIIADNARGLTPDSMQLMFTVQRTAHAINALGLYGYGFKSAVFHLARKCHVISKQGNKITFGQLHGATNFEYPMGYVNPGDKNWNPCQTILKQYGIKGSKNGTIIVLSDLKDPPTNNDIINAREQFALMYYEVFSQNNDIKLFVNDVSVKYINILAAEFKSKKGKKGQTSINGWRREPKVYIDANGVSHNLLISTGVLPDGAGDTYAGFCRLRNGRLVAYGCKWHYEYVCGTQASVRRLQILIEDDEKMDRFYNMSPTKTLGRDQRLNQHFFVWLNDPKMGLKEIIKQQHATSQKTQSCDLSAWDKTLVYAAKMIKKNESSLTQLELVSKKQTPSPNPNSRKSKSNTGQSNAGSKKLSSSLDSFKGKLNIELEPLGIAGPEYDYTDRLLPDGTSQLVIIFNESIAFVESLMTQTGQNGRPPEVSKKYFYNALSQVLALKTNTVTTEEQNLLSEINEKLFSKRGEYGAGDIGNKIIGEKKKTA